MSRRELLGLFVALAHRPHHQCLHRLQPLPSRPTRCASTKALPKKAIEQTARESAKKIPLHVGIDRNPDNVSAVSRIPIPKGEKGEKFIPSVLARPLGLSYPPRVGQNSPLDKRTLAEKRADFEDYSGMLQRRQVYLRTYFRPYFQEWKRLEHFKGKSFQSSPRLFLRNKALYFPNIWGQTLSETGDGPDGGRDSTPVLTGKISIVGIQANEWAEEQVDTFVSPKSNPDLQSIIDNSTGMVQRVDVNMTKDWMTALIVKLSRGRIRKKIPQERWSRYFMIKLPRDIRKGLSEEARDAMGMLNSSVGYVYLIDSSCKIRWAGSGHAWNGEVEGLNAGISRLIEEEKGFIPKKSVLSAMPPKSQGVTYAVKRSASYAVA